MIIGLYFNQRLARRIPDGSQWNFNPTFASVEFLHTFTSRINVHMTKFLIIIFSKTLKDIRVHYSCIIFS